MSTRHPGLMAVARSDPRYAYEAYEFLFEALRHTQRMYDRAPASEEESTGPEYHVSGAEMLAGFCDLALREFGRMARVVLHQWGIDRTDDVGEMVFNLINANLLSKTDNDQRSDFQDLFNLDEALLTGFTIKLQDAD